MTTNTTTVAPAALAELKAATAASENVAVLAPNMLVAQGFRISAESRALLVRKADALRAVLGADAPQKINVPVLYVHNHSEVLGYLEYTL